MQIQFYNYLNFIYNLFYNFIITNITVILNTSESAGDS